MADAPSTSAAAPQQSKGKKKAAAAAAAAPTPREPFKPAKYTHYDRTIVDYVRTATGAAGMRTRASATGAVPARGRRLLAAPGRRLLK